MLSPAFATVSATDGSATLADLSVTGYEAPYQDEEEEWDGGTAGEFRLRLLNADGSTAAMYYWVDNGEVAAGWYANNIGSKAIAGGASSVKILAGRGAWCSTKGYKLQSAGAVNEEDVAFETNSGSGYTACGNATPITQTLDKLYVTGYSAPYQDEEEEWDGGTAGEFRLRLLNSDGSTAATYYWVDNGEVAAGWYANNIGSKAIEGGAASVSLVPGKGMWCSGKGYTLNIPAPEL